MSSITARIPVAEVSRRAHQVKFGKTLLAVVTGILFGAGWLVAKVFSTAWLVLAWVATAARLGWENAQTRASVPRLTVAEQADLLAERERLRAEVARLTGG